MKIKLLALFIFVFSVMFLTASASEAIFSAILDKVFQKDRAAEIIPTSPNPVVLEVRGRSFDSAYSQTVKALKMAGYQVKEVSKTTSSVEIRGTLRTDSPYVRPEPSDYIRAVVAVSITSEDPGVYLVSIKGEYFPEYVLYKHRPPFLISGEVAKVVEQQLMPSVIVGDILPTADYFIANTDYKISDIERIRFYCKPNTERWSRNVEGVAAIEGKEFEPCQRQLEVFGGFLKLIGDEKKVKPLIHNDYFRRNLGMDHFRRFHTYADFYKVGYDGFPAPNPQVAEKRPETVFETPYEVTNVIELKDGKTLTLIGLREDIFRKRL